MMLNFPVVTWYRRNMFAKTVLKTECFWIKHLVQLLAWELEEKHKDKKKKEKGKPGLLPGKVSSTVKFERHPQEGVLCPCEKRKQDEFTEGF